MGKCMNLVSGEVCEYFVFGFGEKPAWFKHDRYIEEKSYVVRDTKGVIHVFENYTKYGEMYKMVPSDTVESVDLLEKGKEHVEAFNDRMDKLNSMDSLNVDASFVSNSIDHVVKKCKSKETGIVYDCFIVGSGDEPDWFKRVDSKRIEQFKDYADLPLYAINNEKIYLYENDKFFDWYDIVCPASAEYGSMEKNEGVTCPVGGCGNKSAAARFCRCRNDHSVIHEYFIYGIDAPPSWFDDTVYSKNTCVVRRGDSGSVFVMSKEDFIKNIEDCQIDGTVAVLDEPISETDKTNVTKDENTYNWLKVVNSKGVNISVVDDPKKLVINDGTKTATDISDIDSAKLWFHGLPADVCKYLVLRHISISGTVDMVDLYHSQSF
jgi:hypothetical protein